MDSWQDQAIGVPMTPFPVAIENECSHLVHEEYEKAHGPVRAKVAGRPDLFVVSADDLQEIAMTYTKEQLEQIKRDYEAAQYEETYDARECLDEIAALYGLQG